MNAVKVGESCKMVTPSQVLKRKGVESRRPPPKSYDMVKAYSGPQTVRVTKVIVVKITRRFWVQVPVCPLLKENWVRGLNLLFAKKLV